MFVIRLVYNITQEVITMADFSSKLRDIIESRGVTQSWLAEKTGATEATISRYLSGVHKPNLDIVARIAQALNVSIDYIMDLSLSPTPYKELERAGLLPYARGKNIRIAAKARRDSRMKRQQSALVIDFVQFKNRNTEKADLAASKDGFHTMEVNKDGEDS